MAAGSEKVRIDLTEPQRVLVKEKTSKDAEALELSVEELEQRIAPIKPPSEPGRSQRSGRRRGRFSRSIA